MSPKNSVCAKCSRKIQDRRFLNCTVCKKTFDIECTNVSEKRFYLMDHARKSLWSCEKCMKRKNKPTTSTPIIKAQSQKVISAPITRAKQRNLKPETVNVGKSSHQQPSPMQPVTLEMDSLKGTAVADFKTGNDSSSSLNQMNSPRLDQMSIAKSHFCAVDVASEDLVPQPSPLLPSPSSPLLPSTSTSSQTATQAKSSMTTILQSQATPSPLIQQKQKSTTSSPLKLASPTCTANRAPDCSMFVTQRRKNNFHEMSLPNIESTDSSLSQSELDSLTTKSLPDLSTLQYQELEIMKNEIFELKMKLEATENEMDNLVLENKSMAIKIKEQDQKIKDLLTICSSTTRNKKSTKKNKTKHIKENFYHSILNQNTNEKYAFSANEMKTQKKPPPLKEKTDHTTEEGSQRKTKVVVIADQQGRGVQRAMQQLLGTNYVVTCFWKDGACLQEVLSTCSAELRGLTFHDFVVVIGGINENNSFNLKTLLLKWLSLTCHTNIIISGLPCNANLNISLNKEIKLICRGFSHCSFVSLNYFRSRLGSRYFLTDLCFGIFREITHVCYRNLINHSHGVIIPCSPKSESCLATPEEYQTPILTSQTLPFL
jgi:hypothetical protein